MTPSAKGASLVRRALVCAPLFAALLSGCATHESETASMRSAWYAGNTQAAQARVVPLANESGPTDELVWLLEEGAVTRANNDLNLSISTFERANSKIQKFDSEPSASVSNETAGVLLNQSYETYRGYNYDKIMAAVYQALNYMEAENYEMAAVYLKRLEFYQQDAERLNAGRIAAEAEEIRKANERKGGGSYNVEKTLASPGVKAGLEKYYGADFMNGVPAAEARALYVNPFAYWIAGLFFANKYEDAADRERAATFFRLAYESGGKASHVIASDMRMAEDLANGKIANFGNVTYVIFESGSAPIRKQFRLDLPLFIFSKDIPYVGVNFPYLQPIDSYTPYLRAEGGGVAVNTEKIADMDDIIRREFNDRLPGVILKTVLSSAIKAGAQYAAQQAVDGDWKILVAIGGSIFQGLLNDADLRTWTTLPKQISIAKLDTPVDGIIRINGSEIKVDTAGTNVILVKQMTAGGALIIRTFNFNNSRR